VAFVGDTAPGPEGGQFSFDFELGDLNNRGQLVITADVSTGGDGVFLTGPNCLAQLFRAGEPAPGGSTFGGYGSFSPDVAEHHESIRLRLFPQQQAQGHGDSVALSAAHSLIALLPDVNSQTLQEGASLLLF
jgi:hypothetical protein